MNIDNFESYINSTILSRGKSYYQNGNVVLLEENADNEWIAEVEGSETYNIEISLNGAEITDYFCDCPYDGDICKHTVAVLFELRKELKNAKPKEIAAKKSTKLSIENLLEKISHKELKEFILQYNAQNKEFGNHFYLHFSDKDDRIDIKEKYNSLISKLIKQHTDRHGFADYRQSQKLGREMTKFLENHVSQAVNNNNFQEAFVIIQIALPELMSVAESSDDSSGEIGGAIAETLSLLNDLLSTRNIAIEFRQKVFDYLATEALNKFYFDYGDYGSEILEILLTASPSIQKPTRFLEIIEQLTKIHAGREYYQKEFVQLKIAFLQKVGKGADAAKMLEENMQIPEIRQTFVEEAVNNKNYEKAKWLLKQGIFEAEKLRHPGTVFQWEQQLLKIAQIEKNTEDIAYYAKKFYLDSYSRNEPYYNIWKNCYTKEEWKNEVEKIIQQIIKEEEKSKKEAKYWHQDRTFQRLMPFLVNEKYFDRMFAFLEDNLTFDNLCSAHPYLKDIYPNELCQFYKPFIEKWATQLSNTSEYEKYSNFLIKIKKEINESREMIDDLVRKLEIEYAKRPALKRELAKVKKYN